MAGVLLRDNLIDSALRIDQTGERLVFDRQNHVAAPAVIAGNLSAPGEAVIGETDKAFRLPANSLVGFPVEQGESEALHGLKIYVVEMNADVLLAHPCRGA